MTKSEQLFEQAQALMPGGVNSPVRSFKGVGGQPLFFKQGKAAYLIDVDNKSYIDYVCSWGPIILGHCYPQVIHAIAEAMQQGISFGAPTELEIKFAQTISKLMPAIEKIRLVNSGTEATMTGIRLARGFTGKNKIIKFIGCYHGHHDSLLIAAGSGLSTLAIPNTPGIPVSTVEHTLLAEFNNIDQVATLFAQYPNDIAAVIIEPIAGNMNLIMPEYNFLHGLRKLCTENESLLIFDEVMTGFRVALGGAQSIFNIKPDLVTLGKIIGGGLPIGAVGGKSLIMDYLAPVGPVYQAGTLSGNPLALAAGLATLEGITKPGFYTALNDYTLTLGKELTELADAFHIPLHYNSIGGMFGLYFGTQENIRNYQDITSTDKAAYNLFFHAMLQQGIYFAPSMYEVGFISSAHQTKELQTTIKAAERVFALNFCKSLAIN